MSSPNEVLCDCDVCLGVNFVSEKTRRKHIRKKLKSEDRKDPGSSPIHKFTKLTVFQFSVLVTRIFNKYPGVTQNCVDDILNLAVLLSGTLIESWTLPKSFKDLQGCLEDYLVPVKKFSTCKEECDIFSGDAHRCKRQSCTSSPPARIYSYIPIVPRLRQIFAIPELARQIQSHQGGPSENDLVSDVHESAAWKELYGRGGRFDGDFRAIALEFSADGFQPFHHSTSKPYSIEHQAALILNFPATIRCKPGLSLLLGLIPGPSPPKEEKYNLYLRPFVDELEHIETQRIMIYDSYKEEYFRLRVGVIIQCHDFPGQAKVFHGQGSGGKQACPMCRAEGVYASCLHKIIHRSGREFLAPNDALRMDTTFPGGTVEMGQPLMRDHAAETVVTAARGIADQMAQGTASRSLERSIAKQVTDVAKKMGARKRCSEFDRLGKTEASKIAVDGMHTVQGVAKNVHGIVNGHNDGKAVRDHEKTLGRFPGCYADEAGKIGGAPFTMSRNEKAMADARLKTVSIPEGKGCVPSEIFGNFHTMKSHTWHVVFLKGIYPFAIRGLLGESQRRAVMKFCYALTLCSSRTIYMGLMTRVDHAFQRSICLMDREFPETLKTILWHMLHHFPGFIARYGPLHSYWMFFFERQIHTHVSRLHNRRHPEAAIIKSHRINAMCALVEIAEQTPTTQPSSASQPTTPSNISDNELSSLKSIYIETYPEMAMEEFRDQGIERATEKWHSERRDGMHWRGSDKWGERGSVVFQRDRLMGSVCFGHVLFFFSHIFSGRKHSFAAVRWFDVPEEDMESKLMVCNPKTTHPWLNPFVHIDNLSEPLICANESNDRLFVLDFMDRDRYVEILDWLEK